MTRADSLGSDHRHVLRLILERDSADVAISRSELEKRTGIDDRRVRKIVAELVNEHGYRQIVGAATGGYYAAKTPEARARYARREIGKGLKILKRAREVAGPVVFAEEAGQIRLLLESTTTAAGVVPDKMPAQSGDRAMHGKQEPGNGESEPGGDDLVRGEDGKPRKCWCGKFLRGRQERFCSDFHRDIHHGRRKPDRRAS